MILDENYYSIKDAESEKYYVKKKKLIHFKINQKWKKNKFFLCI